MIYYISFTTSNIRIWIWYSNINWNERIFELFEYGPTTWWHIPALFRGALNWVPVKLIDLVSAQDVDSNVTSIYMDAETRAGKCDWGVSQIKHPNRAICPVSTVKALGNLSRNWSPRKKETWQLLIWVPKPVSIVNNVHVYVIGIVIYLFIFVANFTLTF